MDYIAAFAIGAFCGGFVVSYIYPFMVRRSLLKLPSYLAQSDAPCDFWGSLMVRMTDVRKLLR